MSAAIIIIQYCQHFAVNCFLPASFRSRQCNSFIRISSSPFVSHLKVQMRINVCAHQMPRARREQPMHMSIEHVLREGTFPRFTRDCLYRRNIYSFLCESIYDLA